MDHREDSRPEWGKSVSKVCLMPQRVVLVLMGFFSLICTFTCRVSLSHAITILAVSNKTKQNTTDELPEGVCPQEEEGKDAVVHKGIYTWSETEKGFILGSFYFGYLISHLPGGVLADKYGAKWVVAFCVGVTGICELLSPASISWGPYALITLRVLMGIAQGPIFPGLNGLLSSWVPKKERGTLGTLCFGGSTMGIILSNACSGMLLHHFHWSVMFYVFGTLSVIWFIIFAVICTSSPYSHPFIKPKEREYLADEVGNVNKDKPAIPWKPLMLSIPMLSLIISQMGHDWGYYVMVTNLPLYMADVIRFSIRSNGLATALPYIAMWIASIISGLVADWLIRKEKLKLVTVRKLFTLLSAVLPGIFMIAASYAGCNKALVVALFTISMFTMGMYYAGQKLSALDISPSYSSTITAVINGLGSFTGLFAPPIIGLITPDKNNTQWRIVFWISAIILTLSAIVFWVIGSADVQPYDPMYEKKDKPEENKNK
ncbi:sialin-like [Drosophila obscura]|uniref:sialin-like n=1 Tax=Drosophila obscura TaxID=7282 RepID=UPI000B9FCC3D|nr:sialin-like [Drosophila obscura]